MEQQQGKSSMGPIIITIIVVLGLVAYFVMHKEPKTEDIQPTNMEETNEVSDAGAVDKTDTVKDVAPSGGTQTLAGGLKITILKEGTGATVKAGDNVSVNYTGMFENGTKFDSNVDPAFKHVEPFTVMNIGQARVIQGWNEGLIGMKVGEKAKLFIPSELAYGERGSAPVIPPNADLVFEIEVLAIVE